jgi:hypothetical protein
VGAPRPAVWYASQLDELSEELFSESATLYAEHGVALQDGLREVSRHLRAMRLLACGQVLRPLERILTKAVGAPRDEQEREWLTTVRSLLTELRASASEVQEALREFDEQGRLGWKSAGESMGVRTEWRYDDKDESLWIRMDGEVSGARLLHAAAVAHESELWPRWMPFCTAGETLEELSPSERVIYVQFDFGGLGTSVLKRGATLHWRLSESLAEHRSLLLLGASLDESSPIAKPAAATNVAMAEFRAIKVLVRPRTDTLARVQLVANVDLHAKMPQALVSMVTKKIAGALLPMLMREAQRVSATAAAEVEAGASGPPLPAAENPYLRRLADGGDFYVQAGGMLSKYFDLFGAEDEDEGEEELETL